MSFLYPLILAGIAAVTLPIVLHMIRRHTRNRVTFSSLMFLRTTTPRLRNRRRLEHIPLLILRCLILCLLAFAFARPFLRKPIAAAEARPGTRAVVLIDTSASMRRAGMWERAVQEARSVLADMGPTDRACVMTFDRETRMMVSFEQWSKMDASQRLSVTIQSLTGRSPGWGATNLGQALIAAAEAIEDDETDEEQQTSRARRVVLIGDLQQGSDLTALPAYEWPERTELAIRAVLCEGTTNASLQWVTTRDPLTATRQSDPPSIRITNSADATENRFQLRWAEEGNPVHSVPVRAYPETPDGVATNGPMEVYVPAGRSIMVQAPPKPDSSTATKLVLTGDDHDFDNTLYIAAPWEQPVNILYIGNDDPNDTDAMLYYVRQAFGTANASPVEVLRRASDQVLNETDVTAASLVIVANSPTPESTAPLRRYLGSGGAALLVMRSAEAATTLSSLSGISDLDCREAEGVRYAMLDSIDFKHPLLASFSEPRFGDFTRIHFWKYRCVDLTDHPQVRVLARFDSGDPAWFEVSVGEGSLLVWTSGWHPSDSDLALSSKFVPLLYSILEHGGHLAERQSQYFAGDSVHIGPAARRIRRPDGAVADIDPTEEVFTQTDLPGLYTIESVTTGRAFAVNLPPAESRTEPLPIEDLERMGIAMKPVSDVTPQPAGQTTQRSSFAQMESEQKLWRWVLVAALALILIEIWLGGWLIRPSDTVARASSPWGHGLDGHATEKHHD
ncbi:MAG: BatA domain-containing protein [Phycisphaerae bacterium]|nr:BatA domain-containing protein [Phycisphaerae bacterium]